jgi:HEAT repeat protein
VAFTVAAMTAFSATSASPEPAAAPAPTPVSQAAAAPGADVADLVTREKLRAEVEAILGELETPGESAAYEFQNTTDRLLLLGPGVIPYLLNELDRQESATYHTAVYTLGHLEGPGIVEGVRKSLERLAKEEENKLKRAMKATAAHALALHRVPDIVDIMLSGTEPVGRMPWMEGVPLLQMATVLGGRDAVLQLLARVDDLRQDPAREFDLLVAMQALSAAYQPEVTAKLLSLLDDARVKVRIGALACLARSGDPAVLDAVIAHLDAGNVMEKQAAADALFILRPLGREKALLAKLETETDSGVRGQLYMTLADLMGEGALPAFVSHWKRPDPLDRVGLLRAAVRLRSPKTGNLLRDGLKDTDSRVVTIAMEGLAQLPGAGFADTLLALLQDPRESVSRNAAHLLAVRHEPRAGARVADLLLKELAPGPRLSVGDRRDRVRVLGEALVDLQFTAVSEDLGKATAAEQDPELTAYLQGVVRRLDALRVSGEDRAKWAALLRSDDPAMRHLARTRLGALGGAEAARVLIAAFGRDVVEDRELLGELGRTGSAESAPLLEKILVEPAFDPEALRPLREGAAYGARLLGGPRMVEALRRSAERRQGRDPLVVVYYALVASKDAVPLIRQVRAPSLTWYEWNRGKDLDRIDFMLRRFTAGQSIASLDQAPEYLIF